MKVINARTKEVAELEMLDEMALLDYWHPFEPGEFSAELLLKVYGKIKRFVVKLRKINGEEVAEDELADLLNRGETIVAVLKNGVGYLLDKEAIGHPLISLSLKSFC